MTYDWKALAILLATLFLVSTLGRSLVYRVPALKALRDKNTELDKVRGAELKEPWVIESGKKAGAVLNTVFALGVLPFFMTLQPVPAWRYAVDVVAILMVYDFYYYLTHRFAFHGVGWLKRVHGVHHQALDPVAIDSFYVHPVETAIGILLFFAGILTWALIIGPIHVTSVIVCYLAFVYINTFNHIFFDLNKFPYRMLHYAVAKHHVHHKHMYMGNFATLTLFYDFLFGTLDKDLRVKTRA